ncbi:DNA-binding transcriptional regulator of glucitol operon [Allocatelliglobosispora scoriae]|uniref:DNA-binding transcriptional regulator of glucitol operon n=1 Tax=Allocatelliglobosispora scoriae TaxID=643052 RepID=A0A841BN34_9ACTN|nr:hypothetical protein [Allocatelliglobosispora scoriae]MBB5870487.1 DNA-binding transcriptional regulator of glucitol operon [Allocatelliglobosispora scoriae]
MRPLLTPRWLLRHGIALVLVLACAGLAWWQVTRAMGGNSLSFGYALLWPVFGLFVIVIWWREVRVVRHGEPIEPDRPAPAEGFRAPVITRHVSRATAADDVDDDPVLAAYNEYLRTGIRSDGARAENSDRISRSE